MFDVLDEEPKYFPEYYLSKWFEEERGEKVSVWTIPRDGCNVVREAYEHLIAKFNADCFLLVDGGSDSLMRGDECGTGSITEDFVSILSLNSIYSATHEPGPAQMKRDEVTSILMCLGLGVDRFHGVSDVSSLRTVAELTESGGFLGSWSLLPTMDCVKRFKEASEFAWKRMQHSIVGTSIRDAIDGKFGDFHSNPRTKSSGTKLFINPLMSMYFCFDLEAIADRIDPRIAKKMLTTTTLFQAAGAVEMGRREMKRDGDLKEEDEDFPKTRDHFAD
jgi:hypothetical protein